MPVNELYEMEKMPYLTADLPGVGGVIKRYDEDFVVQEIPRYEACGEGTHVYFTIEKRGLTTHRAIGMIARALGRRDQDIGYAGLKDAHGVTRQTMSVEHIEPSKVESLTFDKMRIVSVTRHTNKLKLGHLAGNRFILRIRDTVDSPLHRAKPIFDQLVSRGVPNYFGPQRFGVRGDNAIIGKAVLCEDFDKAIALMLGRPTSKDRGEAKKARESFDAGDIELAATFWQKGFREQAKLCRALIQAKGNARKAWRSVHHSMRKFYISAFQSELFNETVARRIDRIDQLQDGDIAWKHVNGASFRVEDVATEQLRCKVFEISPTGPIFGKKMAEPTGESGEIEEAILAATGLSRDQIRSQDGKRLDGARRPLRIPVQEAQIDAGSDENGLFLRLSFALPKGSYATCLTREISK